MLFSGGNWQGVQVHLEGYSTVISVSLHAQIKLHHYMYSVCCSGYESLSFPEYFYAHFMIMILGWIDTNKFLIFDGGGILGVLHRWISLSSRKIWMWQLDLVWIHLFPNLFFRSHHRLWQSSRWLGRLCWRLRNCKNLICTVTDLIQSPWNLFGRVSIHSKSFRAGQHEIH